MRADSLLSRATNYSAKKTAMIPAEPAGVVTKTFFTRMGHCGYSLLMMSLASGKDVDAH